MSSNLHLLTHSHALIASKKRAKRTQVKQVVFDEEARREFLTGFHKRKVAKAEAARKKAAEREKKERLDSRREQRRMLKEQAAENAAQVESAYGAIISDDETEWHGIQDSGQKEQEHEFGDQEVVATVAVVEDFDPDSLLHGNSPETSSSRPKQSLPSIPTPPPTIKKVSTKKDKLKKKKIRYETKDARRAERSKQRARRTEKAEIAGGKPARNKGKKRR